MQGWYKSLIRETVQHLVGSNFMDRWVYFRHSATERMGQHRAEALESCQVRQGGKTPTGARISSLVSNDFGLGVEVA